jgi:hypothetical protein
MIMRINRRVYAQKNLLRASGAKTKKIRGLNKRNRTCLKGFLKVEGHGCEKEKLGGFLAKQPATGSVDRYVVS